MTKKQRLGAGQIRLPVGCQAAKIRLTPGSVHHIQAIDWKPFIGRRGRALDAKTQNSAMLAEMGGVSF
jgi:hypothetical protein